MSKAWPVLLAAISLARAEVFPIRAFSAADGLAEDRVNAIVEVPTGSSGSPAPAESRGLMATGSSRGEGGPGYIAAPPHS